jgi:hypothetical protein
MQPAQRFPAASVAALALALFAGSAGASDADDEAFYQRASTCAAAMQFDQLALVAKARTGATDVRPELLQLTKLGFAYVGEAYLKGLRDPRGSDMLKAATAEQKGWPEARHKALVTQCLVEARKVYDNAGMWQWPVDNKARKRVDRFLSMPASVPASTASR